MNCEEFFSAYSGDSEKVKRLQDFDRRWEWERESASPHSPGVVGDDEAIYRQLLQPVHFDFDEKRPKPTAFDDISNKGLSTDRLNYTDIMGICSRGDARASLYNQANPNSPLRSCSALGKFEVHAIRKITLETGEQAFGVFDTALEENIAHADVCVLTGQKKEVRRVRSILMDIVTVEYC